jgi:integrating conjugative element relaxase (TIGR03760 family)
VQEIILFERQKSTQSKDIKEPREATAITPAMLLLSNSEKRIALIEQLRNAVDLEAERYEINCLSLIQNVAAQCQQLPASANQYYAGVGGFLDQILNRTEAAVTIFREYLEPDQNQHLSEEQRLWMYVLFSAGLLQGIGRLQTDYIIRVSDGRSFTSKHYQAVLDDLSTLGRSYTYTFAQADDDEFRCRLNFILAYKLMPKKGLNWIASNTEAFSVWLALLDEDNDSIDMLSAILKRAQVIAEQRYLKQFVEKNIPGNAPKNMPGQANGRIATFTDKDPLGKTMDKQRLLGAAFIQWIHQQLAAGNLVINQNKMVKITKNGLLLSSNLVKEFTLLHAKHKHWQVVLRAAQAWMNTQQATLSKGGNSSAKMVQEEHHDAKVENELDNDVWVDFSVLPKEVHVQSLKEEKVHVVSALQVHKAAMSGEPVESLTLEKLSLN